MNAKNIEPDMHTFVETLKACAHLGDTQTAYDVLQEMRLQGHEANIVIYNQLIRVYAQALKVPNTPHEHV